MKTLLSYVPALHQGYVDFFERHLDAQSLYIFGDSITSQFEWLRRKDVRAVSPQTMKIVLTSMNLFRNVEILSEESFQTLDHPTNEIVLSDDDESRFLVEKFLRFAKITFDRTFLRWDKSRSLKELPVSSEQVSSSAFHQSIIGKAMDEGQKSSDWWRQVGAVAILVTGEMLYAHNTHVPRWDTPYLFGDPRSFFKKGVHIELTTAIHAEAGIIAESARRGVPLLGASLFVSTFPCPVCAKLIAVSGIKVCYFASGYGMLDGESILRQYGVEIVRVI